MLLEFLRRVEWLGRTQYGEDQCPSCLSKHVFGHERTCSLVSMIRQLEGQRRGKPVLSTETHASFDDKDVRGLYDKFAVVREDGDAKHHHDCRYFPLDLMHDADARAAACFYAGRKGGVLASELWAEVTAIEEHIRGRPCPGPCGGKNPTHDGDPGGLCIHCGPK